MRDGRSREQRRWDARLALSHVPRPASSIAKMKTIPSHWSPSYASLHDAVLQRQSGNSASSACVVFWFCCILQTNHVADTNFNKIIYLHFHATFNSRFFSFWSDAFQLVNSSAEMFLLLYSVIITVITASAAWMADAVSPRRLRTYAALRVGDRRTNEQTKRYTDKQKHITIAFGVGGRSLITVIIVIISCYCTMRLSFDNLRLMNDSHDDDGGRKKT